MNLSLVSMKRLLAIALLCSATAWAAEPAAERTAITAVVNAVVAGSPDKALFTPDADSELSRLLGARAAMSETAKQPWSEVSVPTFAIQSIRFITPDVAMVDAAQTQFGSTISRKIPVLIVIRKEGAAWKIASLRVLTESSFL